MPLTCILPQPSLLRGRTLTLALHPLSSQAKNAEDLLWRTSTGEQYATRKDGMPAPMSDISRSGPALPMGIDVGLAARLQMELIGTLVKAGSRKHFRQIVLAASSGDGLGSLSKEDLRQMFKMRMNIEPVEEVLDSLMAGRDRIEADELMAAIHADIQAPKRERERELLLTERECVRKCVRV